jgi:hypothetical protein
MGISDFTSFEKLIAPTIVKIVYWIGIAFIIIGALFGFFAAIAGNEATTALVTLVATPFMLLGWRLICELYIVVFGMYERLGAIRDALERR